MVSFLENLALLLEKMERVYLKMKNIIKILITGVHGTFMVQGSKLMVKDYTI